MLERGDVIAEVAIDDLDQRVSVVAVGRRRRSAGRDSLGGLFRCTVAGTPGTWKQIAAAPVTADPASGTIPTGYQVRNVTEGGVGKWHGGSYLWIRTHRHVHSVVGGANVPWGSDQPGGAWEVIDLVAAQLSFTLQAGTWLLLAVLRVELWKSPFAPSLPRTAQGSYVSTSERS